MCNFKFIMFKLYNIVWHAVSGKLPASQIPVGPAGADASSIQRDKLQHPSRYKRRNQQIIIPIIRPPSRCESEERK